MNNIINKHSRSIRSINYLLFIALVNINGFFYFFDKSNNLEIFYLIINLLVLMVFFVLNKKFEKEYISSKCDIKTLNGSILEGKNTEIKDLLLKKSSFKENEDTYKLIKEMYVKKNIIAKDYADLRILFSKFIPEKLLKEIGEKGNGKDIIMIVGKKTS